jgi:hypothetical protein
LTTAAAGKGNSPLDAMQMHATYYATNTRGESLMEYLVTLNLNILNQGNEPTIIIFNRKEVTDFTLGANEIGNLVRHWHVSDEPSMSDHM